MNTTATQKDRDQVREQLLFQQEIITAAFKRGMNIPDTVATLGNFGRDSIGYGIFGLAL